MDWQKKIRRLLENQNASALAESVGLHKSAIRDAANSGRMPRADKALKIARALGVDTDWLFDDSLGWHDRHSSTQPDFSEVTDLELFATASARLHLIVSSRIDMFAELIYASENGVKLDLSDEDARKVIDDIKQCAFTAQLADEHGYIMSTAVDRIRSAVEAADGVFGTKLYAKYFGSNAHANALSGLIHNLLKRRDPEYLKKFEEDVKAAVELADEDVGENPF